jgi:hypothetical protein
MVASRRGVVHLLLLTRYRYPLRLQKQREMEEMRPSRDSTGLSVSLSGSVPRSTSHTQHIQTMSESPRQSASAGTSGGQGDPDADEYENRRQRRENNTNKFDRQISSVELNKKFVVHDRANFTSDLEGLSSSISAELLYETPSMGESLLNRLCKDPYVGPFLMTMSVIWPELTINNQPNWCVLVVRLFWFAALRLCGLAFLVGIIGLTAYEEMEYSEPEGIDVINYSLCIVSILQVVSLYPVLYICNQKLKSKASDESVPIRFYRRALIPSVIFFILVALSSVILVAFDCYANSLNMLGLLALALRCCQAVFQLFLGGVLAVNLMFVFVDSFLQSAAIDDLKIQIKQETMSIEQLESIRQNLKRNSLSSLRVNSTMCGIAIINLFFFIVAMYFLSSFNFGACTDSANITLIFAIYFKEILYLLTVLVAAARVNEHGDSVLVAAGSTYSSTSELQLTRAVIYISLQTEPLSYNILGMRPTYTKLALQTLTFTIASIVGIGRSLAEKSAT